MKNKSKTISFLFLISFIIFSSLSWRCVTKGFRPHKISGYDFNGQLLTYKKDPADKEQAEGIINQTFRYFDKGTQAFVFVSEDNNYVIKFIALNKYNMPFRGKVLSPFSFASNYFEKKKNDRNKNLKAALRSYKIAIEELKKETGIIYARLDDSDIFSKTLKIKNASGETFKIDLNQSLFIIQKRAKMLNSYFFSLIKEKKCKEIKKIIADYVYFVSGILKKGIINRDSSIQNGGYIENNFMELDVGRFQKDKNIEENYTAYLQKYTQFYKKALEENIPELLGFFENEISKQIKN